MKKIRIILSFVMIIGIVTIMDSCGSKRDPGRTYMPDMAYSRAYEAYAPNNLAKEDVKKYIRYVADYRLQQLGFKKNWNVKENPLPWIDAMMGKTFGSFFERSIVEYAKANLQGSFTSAYDVYKTA